MYYCYQKFIIIRLQIEPKWRHLNYAILHSSSNLNWTKWFLITFRFYPRIRPQNFPTAWTFAPYTWWALDYTFSYFVQFIKLSLIWLDGNIFWKKLECLLSKKKLIKMIIKHLQYRQTDGQVDMNSICNDGHYSPPASTRSKIQVLI